MKTITKINYSDILVLAGLIAGKNAHITINDDRKVVVYDTMPEPSKKGNSILFNFTEQAVYVDTYKYVVDFTLTLTKTDASTTKFSTVFTPSHVLRYIVKENSTNFLLFYSTSTFIGHLKKMCLKLLFKLRLSHIVYPVFNVLAKEAFEFEKAIKNTKQSSYSIFLGTPGYWRKPVVQIENNNKASHYLKYAINTQTEDLIELEKQNLKSLESHQFTTLTVPKVVSTLTKGALLVNNIQSKNAKHTTCFSPQHFNALQELVKKTITIENIKSTDFYIQLIHRIHQLKTDETTNLLHQSLTLTNPNEIIPFSLAHGDFTSWNTAVNPNKIICYDWEMKIETAPIFYDLFHFFHQSATFFKNKNSLSVFHVVQSYLTKNSLDFDFKISNQQLKQLYQLYLLDVISKNLELIQTQKNCTVDQQKMIQNWSIALKQINPQLNTTTMRKDFITELQSFLLNVNYAILKNLHPQLNLLPIHSDLDMVIDPKDIATVISFVNKHPFVKKTNTIQKSFMIIHEIHFHNNAYLSIDFIFDFIRKGTRYLNASKVLKNRVLKNGFYTPNILDDIEYTQQFYTLNNSDIPTKYQKLFFNRLSELHLKASYFDYYKNKYQIEFKSYLHSFTFSEEKKKKLRTKNNTSFWNTLVLKANYILDSLKEVTKNKGFMLTFSGVDGAGKTTIINEVKSTLEKKYRKKVVLLRHRPGILPIISTLKYGSSKKAEQAAGNRLPRQGKNKNTISSFLRFAYYYTDYILGQVYVYFKYILRGKIVIYDRYYYDFINDQKRSNIYLNRSFIKALFFFIYKPEYNFYLFNTPEVILKRKKELSAQDITSLNHDYQELFTQYQKDNLGTYTKIKNDHKDETVMTIFENIHQIA